MAHATATFSHHMMNGLQLLSSLMTVYADTSKDRVVREAAGPLIDTIDELAEIYGAAIAGNDLEYTAIGTCLRAVLRSHPGLVECPDRLEIVEDAESVPIPLEKAAMLSVIAGEAIAAVVEATKDLPAAARGRIRVVLKARPSCGFSVSVSCGSVPRKLKESIFGQFLRALDTKALHGLFNVWMPYSQGFRLPELSLIARNRRPEDCAIFAFALS